MSKLDGKIALIAGGSGNVGECVVRAFLKHGATVIVPSRTSESLEKLRELLGEFASDRFVPVVGQIGQIEGAEAIRDMILTKFGRIDAVIASLGGSWDQHLPLTQVSMETWQQYLESNLTSHFVAAKTFLPVLEKQQSGCYISLGGGAAETPVPYYSPVAIPAAAQLMLTKVLIEEMKGSGVRINEVVVHSWVSTRTSKQNAKPEWITADEIGEFTAYLASDEASMVNGSILRLYERPPALS